MLRRLRLLLLLGAVIGCGSGADTFPRKFRTFPPESPLGLEEFTDGRPLSGTTLRDLATRYEDLTGEKLEIEKPGLNVGFVRPFGSGPAGWLLLQVYKGEMIP